MMEYTNKYWKMIMPLVKKSLVKRFGKEETALLVQKTDSLARTVLQTMLVFTTILHSGQSTM